MKTRVRRLLIGTAAVAVSTGILISTTVGTSAAAVTPGWEPDANALGTISLFDSSGSPITSGDLDSHPVAGYAAASGDGRTGDTKAQLRAYTPRSGVNPADWSGDSLTASTDYPAVGAPDSIAALTVPVVTGAADDLSLADYIDELPNTSTDEGYQNLYELRLYTSGPGQGPAASYYRVDLEVSVTGTGPDGLPTGSWTVVDLAAA